MWYATIAGNTRISPASEALPVAVKAAHTARAGGTPSFIRTTRHRDFLYEIDHTGQVIVHAGTDSTADLIRTILKTLPPLGAGS